MNTRNVLSVLGVCAWLAACATEEDKNDTTAANAGASSSSSSSGASSGGACGVFAATADACGKCAVEKCCSQGKTCGDDATCRACVARGVDGQLDATCTGNANYTSAKACINGPCTDACNGAPSGSGSGGSCNSTPCSEGPAGDKLCADKGCGRCSFGNCLIF